MIDGAVACTLWACLAWVLDRCARARVHPRERMLLYAPALVCLVPMPAPALPPVVGQVAPAAAMHAVSWATRVDVLPTVASGDWGSWLWMVGVVWLAVRLVRRHVAAARVVRRCRPQGGVWYHPTAGPAVFGVFRPRIVLPDRLRSPSPDRTAALAHERAHRDAGDPVLALLMECVAVVAWPIPGVWVVRHRVRVLMEVAADATAGQVVGRRAYGEALLASSSATSAPAVSLASSHGAILRERLQSLPHRPPRSWRNTLMIAAASVLVLVASAWADAPAAIRYELQLTELTPAEARGLPVGVSVVEAGQALEGALLAAPTIEALPGQEALFEVSGEGGVAVRFTGDRSALGWTVDLRVGTVDATGQLPRDGSALRLRSDVDGRHWLVQLRPADASR